MKVNAKLITKLRKQRSWSQDELAIASGLNLRTIQRIEKRRSSIAPNEEGLGCSARHRHSRPRERGNSYEALSSVRLE